MRSDRTTLCRGKDIVDNKIELEMIEKLSIENENFRKAGGLLAQRALYVITNRDGLHRLSLAVANWAKTIANEGERSKNKKKRKK